MLVARDPVLPVDRPVITVAEADERWLLVALGSGTPVVNISREQETFSVAAVLDTELVLVLDSVWKELFPLLFWPVAPFTNMV